MRVVTQHLPKEPEHLPVESCHCSLSVQSTREKKRLISYRVGGIPFQVLPHKFDSCGTTTVTTAAVLFSDFPNTSRLAGCLAFFLHIPEVAEFIPFPLPNSRLPSLLIPVPPDSSRLLSYHFPSPPLSLFFYPPFNFHLMFSPLKSS